MPDVQKLVVKDFLEDKRVTSCIDSLKTQFNETNPLIVSDVIDKDHQYVHLVQKGGGVLGVALVGYTYVLEQMGIRFLKLAGTSAGAINTALMTVIDNKQDAKSEKILDAICKLDFFSLVDGHPAAQWLIKRFIKHDDFGARVKKWLLIIVSVLGLLIAGDILLTGLQYKFPALSFFAGLCFMLTGIWLLTIIIAAIYTFTLLKRLKNAGFGINPGDVFYNWIKDQLAANQVNNVTDLVNKASKPIPGLAQRVPTEQGLKGLEGEVVFIASELVTQSKIQFPAMCKLFREENDIDSLSPAGFIRASMSIPVFFESYMINDIPCDHPAIKKIWEDMLNVDDTPSTARFVDGGILSNFPLNIFFNPNVNVPRVPVFGIDLDDKRPEDKTNTAGGWSLLGYLGRMFNTVRNYYDKDFLIKNKIYEKGIGSIKVSQYNWLNFFLSDTDKRELFVLGAQAATAFLKGFEWETYKGTRKAMQKLL